MGKGDKKTKRGKIIKGSYGVSRPKKSKNSFVPEVKPVKKKAKPVEKVKDEEVVAVKEAPKKTATKKAPAKKKTTATKAKKAATPEKKETKAEKKEDAAKE